MTAIPARNAKAPRTASALANRHRYFDAKAGGTIVQVLQGDFYVTTAPDEILNTVLGSCIAACIRDPVAGCGGMNHFLLPDSGQGSKPDVAGLALRYGGFSMEQLINEILKLGGQRERLEVKVFGGANVVRGLSGVGHRNADFVEEFLDKEGLRIVGQHLRGTYPRKVQFFPLTGQVRMRELRDNRANAVFEQEVKSAPKVVERPSAGSIELFD